MTLTLCKKQISSEYELVKTQMLGSPFDYYHRTVTNGLCTRMNWKCPDCQGRETIPIINLADIFL